MNESEKKKYIYIYLKPTTDANDQKKFEICGDKYESEKDKNYHFTKLIVAGNSLL